MQISFFDSNICLGNAKLHYPGWLQTKAEILEEMKLFSIDKALCRHTLGREYDPMEGNEILRNEIAGDVELIPMWTVLPHHTGEFQEPEILIKEMARVGVRAVVLYPAAHNYSLSEFVCGELFDTLSNHRIPLFLSLDQIPGGMDGLATLAMRYPSLPIILSGVGYRLDRVLYPLIDKCENIYIETSSYKPFYGIENFCGRFGAARLIFGSGLPTQACSAAISMILYAEIEEKYKKMIAAENLEQLLGGVIYG